MSTSRSTLGHPVDLGVRSPRSATPDSSATARQGRGLAALRTAATQRRREVWARLQAVGPGATLTSRWSWLGVAVLAAVLALGLLGSLQALAAPPAQGATGTAGDRALAEAGAGRLAAVVPGAQLEHHDEGARLEAEGYTLRLAVRGGEARLEGRVPDVDALARVVSALGAVPGIERVVAEVATSEEPDRGQFRPHPSTPSGHPPPPAGPGPRDEGPRER